MKSLLSAIFTNLFIFCLSLFLSCYEGSELGNSESDPRDLSISYAKGVDTILKSYPPDPSDSTTAVFKFKCNKPNCAFKCQLDEEDWEKCKSPKIYPGLSAGSHSFQVKAKDKATGKWDKTPAVYSWTIQGGGGKAIARAVSAGTYHTCALTNSGGVKCWGQNDYFGLLGDGTTHNSLTPVNVVGLSSGCTAISVGHTHSCAVLNSGAVKCWGNNDHGQLGDGTTAGYWGVPVEVSGLSSGVVAISAGAYHTCALTEAGAVKCWGHNWNGQLGDGNAPYGSRVPVDVSGLSSGVIGISANGDHSCAVTVSGALKCWGENYYGEIGDGSNTDRSVPVAVSGLSSGVSMVAAGGAHTCALVSGGVKCWGYNYWGQVGDGSNVNRTTPVNVSGLSSGVIAVSAGSWGHSCALTEGGGVKCWGCNVAGELGGNNGYNSNVPVDVSGLSSGVKSISNGLYHTCAVMETGGIKCWGSNATGQLGFETTGGNFSTVPGDVIGFGP